ncbi:MAG: glucokinase [Bacteroidetes bacterium RIFCSPLOWO2_12_FULL_35_15]|nr:MAG: glucokinase [Bacteroidetes bacterium RIFCSPLOWO2_12_FULL_35_15]
MEKSLRIEVVAAIDIGGTNTVFGLVDEKGKVLLKESIATEHFPIPGDLVAVVSDHIRKALAQFQNTYELVGVGIGAPNGNYFTGNIEFAPNLKWKGIVPLAKLFSDKLSVKAVLTNDANAAAIGEMMFGAAKGMKDFIFITLGTGLGSGIVVNGEMVYGHDGFAGEIGHVIMFPDGRQCGCGRKGCLETYCSATGIKTTYQQLTTNNLQLTTSNQQPATKNKPPINSKYIYDQAISGDKNAIEAFNYTGELLGLALANSVAYTSPQAIFLFGGLALAGDLIFKPTIENFEKNLLNIYKNKIKILPSQLNENDAAIHGAASLIWKEIK